MDTITLPVRTVKSTDRLDKMIAEVAPEDLRFAIAAVFVQELEKQKALGNEPSNILVDGSGIKQLADVRRNARAYFANRESIRKAAEDALRTVALLVRYKTGKARSSLQIWINSTHVNSVAEAVARMKKPEDRVFIVGPTVEYGRKLYWNPVGKPRYSKSGVRRTIYDIAIRRIKSRNKGVYISESWVETSELGRTPAVSIGQMFRGRLNG